METSNTQEQGKSRPFSQYFSFAFAAIIFVLGLQTLRSTSLNWHPLFLTTGWLLTTRSIFTLSNATAAERTSKVRTHWILHLLALGCTLVGMFFVYNFKEEHNYPHFNTWHSLMGVLTNSSAGLSNLGGLMANNSQKLKKYVKPTIARTLHMLAGTISYFCGGITLNLSLFTKWFEVNSSGNGAVFILAAICLNVALYGTLINPVRKVVKSLYQLNKDN